MCVRRRFKYLKVCTVTPSTPLLLFLTHSCITDIQMYYACIKGPGASINMNQTFAVTSYTFKQCTSHFLMCFPLRLLLTLSFSLCPSLQPSLFLWWTCVGVRPASRWAGSGFRRSRASPCPSLWKITSNTSDWHQQSQLGVYGHKADHQKVWKMD